MNVINPNKAKMQSVLYKDLNLKTKST